MKNIYFLSDAHLGSLAVEHRRTQERRLVRFLDEIRTKASAVYLLGDMFDFWYEYKYVVPRGFTRFLGKLSELTDSGVEVHYFTGNHDIWAYDYLATECGVILHRKSETLELYDKVFYLAHGDGLGDPDKKFKIIRAVFHNSRMKRPDGKEPPYMGEQKEHLVLYAKDYLKAHSDVDFFIFGHRHIELDLMLNKKTRMIILGDWIWQFTYAVFDGEHLFMENYVEGESEP